MKKWCSVILTILALFTCVLFSACGDKYKDLKISFIGLDGNPIESVSLLIDDKPADNVDRGIKTIAVKLSGIDKKDVGEISVKSSPIDLASVYNMDISNNLCTFDVGANVSGSGELIVTHKSSGKNEKIALFISQKASDVSLLDTEYNIEIKDGVTEIDPSSIIKLIPNGSTDKIYFKALNGIPQGVTLEDSVNGYFNKVRINSVEHNTTFKVCPATNINFEGYDFESYTDKEITIRFVDAVRKEEFSLSSTDTSFNFAQNIGTEENPITLISNDNDLITQGTNKHRFNSVPIIVNFEESVKADIMEFYDFVATSNSNSITVETLNSTSHILIAHTYTEEVVPISFKLVPKNVGNLKTLERILYVKGEEKPSSIEIYQQNKPVESDSVDIYNYYESSSNSLGSLFTFVPMEKYSFIEMQGLRLEMDPAILNAKYTNEDVIVGVNTVYESSEFVASMGQDLQGDGTVLTRNSQNVLEFYKFNQPLKFYFDQNKNKVVSEDILPSDKVFIKYSEIEAVSKPLSVDVCTYYRGNELYLQDIDCVSAKLNFNSVDGVKSVKVGAGYLIIEGQAMQEIIEDENSENINVARTGVFINKLDGISSTKSPILNLYDVVGIKGDITSSRFKISVVGGNNNPLKIMQYPTGVQDLQSSAVVNVASNVIEKYEYNHGLTTNSILLVTNQNTDVGEYSIIVEHESNETPLAEIKVTVYKKAEDSDFTAVLNTDSDNFENTNFKAKGYESDYIVAKGSSVEMEIDLNSEVLETGLLTSYNYAVEVSEYKVPDGGTDPEFVKIDVENADNYISITHTNNKLILNFIKGTFDETLGNKYITLYFGAEFTAYENITSGGSILQKDETNLNVQNKITIYIYEKITNDNLEINNGELELYYYDTVGYYNKDKAISELSLYFKENNATIWNYVQDANEEQTGEQKVFWYDENNKMYDANYVIDKTQMFANCGINDNKLSLRFSSGIDNEITEFNIYAQVSQFGKSYIKSCKVNLKVAVLTERLVVTSSVNRYDEGGYYIDLEIGENKEITANNLNSAYAVSHPGIVLAVVDTNNVVTDSVAYAINGENANSVAVHNDVAAVDGLRLFVLSRDLLKGEIKRGTTGFNDVLGNLYLSADTSDKYANSYQVIDLILSDGSEEQPYVINTAEDFWQIRDNRKKDKHFVVMNDIDLSNISLENLDSVNTSVIEEFKGNIKTYSDDVVLTISGLKLSNSRKNLISSLSGKIQNLRFKVNYNYSYVGLKDVGNLGVFGELTNQASLTNVSVVVSGKASLSNSGTDNSEVYFGGLVGENRGSILKCGAYGEILLEGTANLKFGGLVGLNKATIKGDYLGNSISSSSATYPDISFVFSEENNDVLANMVINSSITNTTLAIGMAVGENVATISESYVTGAINHNGNGYVGGVVGKNISTPINSKFSLDGSNIIKSVDLSMFENAWSLKTVKSSVEIVGINANSNYVGGIAGYDEYGVYNDCHYQILTTSKGLNNGSYVGGILGYTKNGVVKLCSVMSYHWNYNELNAITTQADIFGVEVGGIIGKAETTYSLDKSKDSYTASADNELLTTLINLSSVNAYLAANNTCGGFIAECNDALIFNAYFMGKTSSRDIYDFAPNVAPEVSTVYNVFSVKDSGINSIPVNSITTSNRKPSWVLDGSNWGYNSSLNGGYAYITKGEKTTDFPIYDVVPTSISATVKPTDKHIYVADKVVHLSYYDFYLDTTASDYVKVYNELNKQYNTHNVESIFNFGYTPQELRNVQLDVTVNSSIISISQDNKLIVNGVGQCELTFSSVLNPNVDYKVLVDVAHPMGDVVISEDNDDASMAVSNINIAKGKAQMFYVVSTGFKTLQNATTLKSTNYYYRTNETIELNIAINCDNLPAGKTIADYINIGGAVSLGGNVYKLDSNTPFSISVIDVAKVGTVFSTFEFEITPYFTVEYLNEHNVKQTKTIETSKCLLKLQTKEGATDISLGHTNAIIYPNDITIVTAYVKTDMEIEETEFYNFVKNIEVDNIVYNTETEIKEFLTYKQGSSVYNEQAQLQTIQYVLNLENFEAIKQKQTMKINFEIENTNETAVAKFTVLEQRINKIDISNYVYEQEDYTNEENVVLNKINVLKQINKGLIIIDMAPYNGYFDYLEISDVTSSADEIIRFEQVKSKKGDIPNLQAEVSSDGLGKKLSKLDTFLLTGDSSVYVTTRIDSRAISSLHTVRVAAYLDDGTMLIENFININVQMLPAIQVEYLTPDDDVVAMQKTGESEMSSKVANYVPINSVVKFRVETTNASKGITDFTVVTGNAELKQDERRPNIYLLETKDVLGEEIKIKFTARAEYADGNFDETEITISFTTVNFVIYDVTVMPTTSAKPNEIYGNLNIDTNLTFSLEYGDIAHGASIGSKAEEAINKIVNALNVEAGKTNPYLSLSQADEKIKLTANKLRVEDGYNSETKLKLNFELVLDAEHNFTIQQIVNPDNVQFNKEFDLRFVNRTSALEMEVIKDENDFINMASGDAYYILGNDLVLENFTPLDVDIKQFDGNGRTITIKSFAPLTEVEAQVGLFKQIHEGMVVMNVNVVYNGVGRIRTNASKTSIIVENEDYFELTPRDSEVAFERLNFGGITAINNGIITNCHVSGDIALSATQIEELNNTENSKFGIPFYIGGLVAQNTSTGYITHSTVSARMVAAANIGGLVYSNQGQIASCAVNGGNEKGLIYAYKTGLSTSISVQVAGFVVINTGDISMSYSEFGTTKLSLGENAGNNIGNFSSKNESAGFVYSNSGDIKNCYTTLTKGGQSHNTFYGFVMENAGTIQTSYSYVNNGVASNSILLFAPVGTSGIDNCIQIKVYNQSEGFDNGIDGLITLNRDTHASSPYNMYSIDAYKNAGFIFGDNKTGAVYVMKGDIPKIASTLDKVEYLESKEKTLEESVDEFGGKQTKTTYYGLRNYQIIRKNVVEDGENVIKEIKSTIELNHGTKENPYVIYNTKMWDLYFDSTQAEYSTNAYYRIVADLDFSNIYTDIVTTSQTFNGNIQGNDMTISGIRVYSSKELTSVGLFKELIGVNNQVENSIRNLNLSATSINATKTEAVGVLAGIVENFNLYNITLDSADLVVVGGNAVGGIAGLIRGEFTLDKLSSNVSVTSTREESSGYAIYKSVLNGTEASENLTSVYYAGSVAGIVDGYNDGAMLEDERVINSKDYINVSNINVAGRISLVADSVGSAFGFVGEYVYVKNVNSSINADFAGAQYSGGIVGENRGIIENTTFTASNEDAFARSKYVSAGIAGINLGGYITNATAEATIVQTGKDSTVGGIVGRNVNGYVNSSTYNGIAKAQHTGGIIGADYEVATLEKAISGSGAIIGQSKTLLEAVKGVEYVGVENYTNLRLGNKTVTYLFENNTDFYAFEVVNVDFDNTNGELQLKAKSKLFGLFVGLTDDKTRYDSFLGYQKDIDGVPTAHSKLELTSKGEIIINGNEEIFKQDIEVEIDGKTDPQVTTYAIEVSGLEGLVLAYIVGYEVASFDSWMQADYLENYMVCFGTIVEYKPPTT